MTQLQIAEVVEHAAEQTRGAIDAYMQRHRAQYIQYAKDIEPSRHDWRHVWDRFAFAILTANTQVADAVHALAFARLNRGFIPQKRLRGVVPDRIRYVNALPVGDAIFSLLREYGESWGITTDCAS